MEALEAWPQGGWSGPKKWNVGSGVADRGPALGLGLESKGPSRSSSPPFS